jgi:hypothetical protein
VKANLTQSFVHSLPAVNRDIDDIQQPALVLRTRTSGRHSNRVLVGHAQWCTMGAASGLTLAATREVARQVLGEAALARVKAQFLPLFGSKPLSEITPWAVEKWRSARLRGENSVKPGTVNLRAVHGAPVSSTGRTCHRTRSS